MAVFYQSKGETLCGVIVDIGSGSVGASIVLSDHQKERPEIVYTHREFLPERRVDMPAGSIQSMRHALFSVMLDLEQEGMAALRARKARAQIESMLVSCTAPWSHTATQIIRFAQEKPFIVTPQMVEEVILHAYEKEEAHAPGHMALLADKGQHVVEKAIIDVTLNGYPVADPYNKKASEIAIAHVRGLVPTAILTALEDIDKYIHGNIAVRVHTSALVLYCVLRDLYPQTKSALIVDVSGEATELALMQENILYESISVEYGSSTLARDVALFGNTIPEEARGYLRAYKQNVLTQVQEKALAEGGERYRRSLEAGLAELSVRYALPPTIFLILDQDMEQFFVETMGSAVGGGGGHAEKTVIPLSPGSTRDFASTPESVALDPRLAMTARFFHKLHACREIDTSSK